MNTDTQITKNEEDCHSVGTSENSISDKVHKSCVTVLKMTKFIFEKLFIICITEFNVYCIIKGCNV